MRIVLADEISPDNCRLWDATTNEKLDKDRFRRDLGGVVEAYQRSRETAWASCPNRCKARPGSGAGTISDSDMKARVFMTLKNGVLDPQGKAIGHALERAGLSLGRRSAAGQSDRSRACRERRRPARANLKEMCEKLLANTDDREIRDRAEGVAPWMAGSHAVASALLSGHDEVLR